MSDNKKSFLRCITVLFVVSLIFVILINTSELNMICVMQKNVQCVFIAMIAKIVILIISFALTIMFVLRMFDKEINFEHMTGLCSRKKLFIDLNNSINKKAPFTVCYIDFNDFKNVNDKYGHAAGDMLLKEFARRINELKCKKIVGYRIGGDEFVVVINSNIEVDKCIESIWKIADDDVRITLKEYTKISFAMGIAKNDFVSNVDELLKKADYNMYENKKT
jgi:diguanylate cyclase